MESENDKETRSMHKAEISEANDQIEIDNSMVNAEIKSKKEVVHYPEWTDEDWENYRKLDR